MKMVMVGNESRLRRLDFSDDGDFALYGLIKLLEKETSPNGNSRAVDTSMFGIMRHGWRNSIALL